MSISLPLERRYCRGITFVLFSLLPVISSFASPAATLNNKLTEIQPVLENNALGFPVYVTSSVKDSHGVGDIYGLFDLKFSTLHRFFSDTSRWCNALILHIYIKSCVFHRPQHGDPDTVAIYDVYLGTKDYAEPEDVFRFEYRLKQYNLSDDYLKIVLKADDGPIDTNNYRIVIEAIPVSPTRSLIHFHYEANYGFFARSAVSVYLATVGRHHVGFSTTAARETKHPEFIQGLRGVIERNAMRYVISVVSYLETSDTGPSHWLEASLKRWYDYSEIFRAQLHDASLQELVTLKTEEYKNQLRLNQAVSNKKPIEYQSE